MAKKSGAGCHLAGQGFLLGSAATVDLHAPITTGIQVPDLDAAMAMVKSQGIEIESGLFQPGPGIRFFCVRDPDGMHIQFAQQLLSDV